MSDEPDTPRPSASLGAKARIAARGVASLFRAAPKPDAGGAPDVVSPDVHREKRVPPGQVETRRWPVLHAGKTPATDLATWNFRLLGLVDAPASWTWDDLRALPSARVLADMHCVTRWSLLDNIWEGVRIAEILRAVAIKPDARFAMVHADGGYSTNLALADLMGDDCLLAWSHNGRSLEPDHGGPLRLVVPRLYAWKSAKWVRAIEFLADDRPGFWEENGYHNHGDPWAANAKGSDSVERFW